MTLVKLARHRPKISYLVYPDFDLVGHPALTEAFVADLSKLSLNRREYLRSKNPPILHRKELFVGVDYPARVQFTKLTAREDAIGLFTNPERIGTQEGWEQVLQLNKLTIKGHDVVPLRP